MLIAQHLHASNSGPKPLVTVSGATYLRRTTWNARSNASSGVWIWRLGDIRPDHREALSASGCRRIYLKVFDDLHAESMFWKRQCKPELISSMKAAALFGHPGLHRGVPWALLDDKT